MAAGDTAGTAGIDAITLEILWARLIGITDEVRIKLRRTAFSSMIREANDYACVLLDANGELLVQSQFNPPIFVAALPAIARAVVARFGIDGLAPGDVAITNDPWLGAGHLNDIAVVTPLLRGTTVIGFAASIAHSPDIGGRLWSADAREIYEEGLQIPILKLYRAGALNEDLVEVISQNVRVPMETMGDIHSLVAANALMAQRVLELLAHYEMRDMKALAAEITGRSERAMRKAIAELADGTYRHVVQADGFDFPVQVALALTIRGDQVEIDCSGTSPQDERGVNSVFNYSYGWIAYALKACLCPAVANNGGSFRPIRVHIPERTLLNPQWPAALGGKGRIGHYIPYAVFGALAQVLPLGAMAESGNNGFPFIGGLDRAGRKFTQILPSNGGLGARPGKDGTPCTSFPSNLGNVPIEVTETRTSIRVERKALLPDSAGAGRFRGGLGQEVSLVVKDGPQANAKDATTVSMITTRTSMAAQGVRGGGHGSLQHNLLNDGEALHAKKQLLMRPGERLTLRTPGGGGWGPPLERDAGAVAQDVRLGYVSPAQAKQAYGVVLRGDGAVDESATATLRKAEGRP